MTLGEIKDLLGCEIICGGDQMDTASPPLGGRLMSYVLAFPRAGGLS
jgi:hypothetical protein